MVKVIDSDIVIRAYFKKHQERSQLKFADLKRIRYIAEPYINAYIDVTYSSLRRVQLIHKGAIKMDNVKMTIIGNRLRQVLKSEQYVALLLERYL
ncbi:MAG: hypothetical protein CW336_01835 [Bacteroidetes bacterium]|nr:hypothetical protein [Bacteroidota bacterium]